jgi:hypothetical protein
MSASLGSLELIVLVAVARLGDDAYGLAIRRDASARTAHDYSGGAIYTTLERLVAHDRADAATRRTLPPAVPRHRRRSSRAARCTAGCRIRMVGGWRTHSAGGRMSIVRAPQPPHWMHRLLSATGADPEFRDDVLGDMADEFIIRVAYDGEREARAWYVREGLRTLPYLVRNWLTHGPRPNVGYLARVVLKAYALTSLLAGAAFALGSGIVFATGVRGDFPTTAILVRALGLPGLLALAATLAIFGGHTAARIGRRAPFASAVGLGTFWCALAATASVVVSLMRLPVLTSPSLIAGEMVLVMLGTALGGLWRVCTAD